MNGGTRYTFGVQYLWDGIRLVPALIGLFAVAEMINLWVENGSVARSAEEVRITRMTDGLLETFRHWRTVLRGSVIGTVVGAIPGVGGTVAAFLSYSATVRLSHEPETFGRGNIEGVIAPEAAINAKDSSSLIPTLAFGIPGGAEMAVFLGILVLHGMQPGPLILVKHQREIYGLIWALTASCVLASMAGLLLVRPLSKVTLLPSGVLVPIVLCVALTGSWAVDQSFENIILTAAFGVIGYGMIRFGYPRLPVVISLVLGAGIERSWEQSMAIGDDTARIFVERPVCLILLLCVLLGLLFSPTRTLFRRFSARRMGRSPRMAQ
jgi:putative tricarboxylic transport membrane protein